MKAMTRTCLILALGAASLSAHAYAPASAHIDYGSPAAEAAFARRIDIGADTKWINVDATETVALVNAAGQTFVWKFDTAEGIVPLAGIAPEGFLAGHAVDAY